MYLTLCEEVGMLLASSLCRLKPLHCSRLIRVRRRHILNPHSQFSTSAPEDTRKTTHMYIYMYMYYQWHEQADSVIS